MELCKYFLAENNGEGIHLVDSFHHFKRGNNFLFASCTQIPFEKKWGYTKMKEFTPEGANSLLLKLIPIDKESMKIKLELIPFKTIHFKIDTY